MAHLDHALPPDHPAQLAQVVYALAQLALVPAGCSVHVGTLPVSKLCGFLSTVSDVGVHLPVSMNSVLHHYATAPLLLYVPH